MYTHTHIPHTTHYLWYCRKQSVAATPVWQRCRMTLLAVLYCVWALWWLSTVLAVPTVIPALGLAWTKLHWEVTKWESGGWSRTLALAFLAAVLPNQPLRQFQPKPFQRLLLCYCRVAFVKDVGVCCSNFKQEPKDVMVELGSTAVSGHSCPLRPLHIHCHGKVIRFPLSSKALIIKLKKERQSEASR